MFKRRNPRTTLARIGRFFWPRGGWLRAGQYMIHRIRRLPDPAYKISRGIACGVLVSFTPLFGLHFFVSAAIAWLVGGNILAALLSTFFGNPITFPIIAGLSVGIGSQILGVTEPLPLAQSFDSISRVSVELWANLLALFSGAPVSWGHLRRFMEVVFWPYLVGGLILGTPVALASYAVSRPVIAAYQAARISRLKRDFARRRAARQEGGT